MSEVVEVPPVNIAPASDSERVDSEAGEQGGDTLSSQLNQSHSELENSQNNIGDSDSNAPLSSRGSTKATGEDDTMSLHSRYNARPYVGRDMWQDHGEEEEKEPNGSPILTNKFLRELFKKEHRKYYRTPHLNDKLYLHFKGFSKMKNLAQFTELKCLYFEANGCDSMLGLEENTELRSVFLQENCITTIEGLDTLKELRTINLSDNMIRKVTGLADCEKLDTIQLARNRLGQGDFSDVEALEGLLERPSLTAIDIQNNYLSDPEILPQILAKMQNLRVIYSQGNKFQNNISHYRKKVIVALPNLKYLDDRPVFDEDRRRAEAFARGGMDAEREEMKKIKKEKEDKHWANHEAFQLMIQKARDEKKQEEAEKEAAVEKKESMKEMMARAKAEKEAALKDKKDGIYNKEISDKDREFFDNVKDEATKRFQEKQADQEHEENPSLEKADFQKKEAEHNKVQA